MSNTFKRLAPLLNRVLVKKVDPVQKSPGGIILQDNTEKASIGEVVEVGPGIFDADAQKTIPISVKKGDTVLLPDYGGAKINLQNGEFFIYRDSDIIGVLHKD